MAATKQEYHGLQMANVFDFYVLFFWQDKTPCYGKAYFHQKFAKFHGFNANFVGKQCLDMGIMIPHLEPHHSAHIHYTKW